MVKIALGAGRWIFQAEAGRDPLTRRRQRVSHTVPCRDHECPYCADLRDKPTERKAERAHALYLAEAWRSPGGSKGTVADLLEEWYETKGRLSPTTRQEYRRIIDQRIVPALGPVPLAQLTAYDLDRFYAALTAVGLAGGSVHQAHAILSGALRQAKKWRRVKENVALDATPPPKDTQTIKPPTLAVVRLLVAQAQAEDPTLGIAALLAVITGARRGELCGLTWGDVDMATNVVHFRRTVVEVRGQGNTVKPGTKTGDGRSVAIDADTANALVRHLCWQHQRAKLAGLDQPGDASFVLSRSLSGVRPWTPSNVSAAWGALCKRSGVHCRLHDLRHFSVTVLLDAGIPLAVVAQRHGHRDGNVTLGVYGHPVDGRDREAALRMGELLR